MDDVLRRFVAKAPVAVLVRATLAHVLADTTLDALFRRTAQAQYTRELTFSTLVRLLIQVTFGQQPSVHAAYRRSDDVAVSVTAVYDKLNRLETGVATALVRETAEAMAGVTAALSSDPSGGVAGLRLRTLDGNFLAGTDHRLDCLQDCGAAALPGMSLVVREGATGLLSEVIPCEDAYTNERSLAPRVLALVRADDLWLADRNFCTADYLEGIARRGAFFLVRHHAGTKPEVLGEERPAGRNASGDWSERKVRVGDCVCRCLIVRLFRPLRDGSTELRLLTNVPSSKAGARRLAELYRTRWRIETAFQELTQSLRCEVSTLGYPRAALFAFALAMTAYNVLIVVQRALAAGRGSQEGTPELSSYHLANEVAAAADGLTIAVREETWDGFAAMTAAGFACWARELAQGIRWDRYRKSPRGPKKPRQVKRTRRGAHRSTARALRDHTKSP